MIHDIMRKPNSIIVFLIHFSHNIHPQKQKWSVQPFCFWGEHSKGLSNQADIELDMINAISAADIAFIMSSSQAIVDWLNALDQSDFFIVSLMYNKCNVLVDKSDVVNCGFLVTVYFVKCGVVCQSCKLRIQSHSRRTWHWSNTCISSRGTWSKNSRL